MYDIDTVTVYDLVADAIKALNEAKGAQTGSTYATAKFLEARALADVAQAAAAQGAYKGAEFTDGYVAGADSEVDLVVNLDGTTEAGITPEEAATRQALEAEEAEGVTTLEVFADTSAFLRAAGYDTLAKDVEADADDIEADFGAPAASPVFTEALAEQKAGAKKKGKKS